MSDDPGASSEPSPEQLRKESARLARRVGYDPKEGARMWLQDRDLVWVEGGRERATTHPTASERAKQAEGDAGKLK